MTVEKADSRCTLHQPSGAYGVASEPLGKVKNGREILDPDDLATGAEVLKYYDGVMAKFIATGWVRLFPTATYYSESATFVDGGGRRRAVHYGKLVTPESGVVVPRSWERNGQARQRAADDGGRPLRRDRRREDGHRRRAAPAAPRRGPAARDVDNLARRMALPARHDLCGQVCVARQGEHDQRAVAPQLRPGRLQKARGGRFLRPPRSGP
eukprot:scaffold16107_cov67-Phaeocystis_antarctica.AAC.4